MAIILNRLSGEIIQKEMQRIAYNLKLINSFYSNDINSKLEYNVGNDKEVLYVGYKNQIIMIELEQNDTLMCLENFSEIVLFPNLVKLANDQTVYDDAGQVI